MLGRGELLGFIFWWYYFVEICMSKGLLLICEIKKYSSI